MRLGAHVSIAGGIYRAFDRARSAGCETAQIFVKSNRSWKARPLAQEEIEHFRTELVSGDVYPVVGHASYLLNLGSPDDALWNKSRDALIVELERCEALGLPWLVLHPGSHSGAGEKAGLARVTQGLTEVLDATRGFHVCVALETTAGQGNGIGQRFEQIAQLLDSSPQGERLGVCIDTCHIFAAGYDLRTPAAYAATMAALDATIGLESLKIVHLNDSKGELGCHLDRHEHIGKGHIGLRGFWHILHDDRLGALPGILETPKSSDLHEDVDNLATLRELMNQAYPPPLGAGEVVAQSRMRENPANSGGAT